MNERKYFPTTDAVYPPLTGPYHSDNNKSYIECRMRELIAQEIADKPLIFSGHDFADGGVMDLWQELEDRLRPPSPIPPWPEAGPYDDPYYSTRQCWEGLHKGRRILAPWELKADPKTDKLSK